MRSTTSCGRATGDFTLLRAVGRTASRPPARTTCPTRRRHPADVGRGPKEGDYAMLAGYPGITYRHRTAAEFAGQIDTVLPRRVSVFQQMIDTIEAASARTRRPAPYASQLQSLKNNRKRRRQWKACCAATPRPSVPPTSGPCWPPPTAGTRATSRRCWPTCRRARRWASATCCWNRWPHRASCCARRCCWNACASNRPSRTHSARAATSSATRR